MPPRPSDRTFIKINEWACVLFTNSNISCKQIPSLKIVGKWHTSSESFREEAEPLSKEGLGCHGIFNHILWHPISSRSSSSKGSMAAFLARTSSQNIFSPVSHNLQNLRTGGEGNRNTTVLTLLNTDSEAIGVRVLHQPLVLKLCCLLQLHSG